MASTEPRGRDDRGTVLLEAVLTLPVLFMLIFGVIDFGFVYGDSVQIRQGVRDGGRAASAAVLGDETSCEGLTTGETNEATRKLLCLTRQRIGLDTDKMRTKICFAPSADVGTCPSGNGGYVIGGKVVVCAMYPATSRSGFNPVLDGRVLRSRIVLPIFSTQPGAPVSAEETPLIVDGVVQSWSFCVA